MQSRELPFSRIRIDHDHPTTTLEEFHQSFRIAYADPEYPPEARSNGVEGKVVLDTVIGKDGSLLSLSVREGHPVLAAAALETVRHWAYRPVKVNGVAVEVATQIEIIFTLPDRVSSD